MGRAERERGKERERERKERKKDVVVRQSRALIHNYGAERGIIRTRCGRARAGLQKIAPG